MLLYTHNEPARVIRDGVSLRVGLEIVQLGCDVS